MLEKIQFYINYAKAVINYGSKVIDLVSATINSWPKWVHPTKTGPFQQSNGVRDSGSKQVQPIETFDNSAE
jgi:hypothetical protein